MAGIQVQQSLPPYAQPQMQGFAPPPPQYVMQPAYPVYYPPVPQTQIIMTPQQPQQQQQQQQQNVNVTVHTGMDVVVVKQGVNHVLHLIITLFFFPWIFVWIAFCIIYGEESSY
ncbi:uncharacterized protein LOC106050708 [Biomphalaria glabrata]|uniref:Uncharacterized protein LOC106050708 n=1 Tax=Biomphalaria glabrata TaxID=6526 RepID=A0A9W3AYF0_BIOGL|nr:uncharacterized protein LOC106050708 [Biomphalaria glabrata]XP_055892246.1 uncharacterized protein LOC106050708 [Biomphalaria glabrata]XP_055892247.1 uncharacterized protein LOC106050708 [Biomphalaria glabrata]